MSDRMKQVSYARLNEIVSGFRELKGRKLPNVNVDLRVAAQFKNLATLHDLYQEVRKKVISEHEMPDTSDAEEIKLKNKLELRNKLDSLDKELVEVKLPLKRLTKDDLPQSMKGDANDLNQAGLAAIMVALAPEYFDLPEEEDI